MKLRGLLTLLLGLFLLGCTHDSDIDGAGANSDGTTNVNIKATLPEFGGATRGVDSSKGGVANIDWTKYELRIIVKAYGTGDYAGKVATEAVDYKVAEKDASGNYLPISIDLDLPLTIGHSYDIYLWADYVLQSEPTNDLHYNIDKFPAITLKGDNQLVINDETRDAFFGRNRVYIKSTGIVWDKPMNTMIERAVTKLRLVATDAAGASATSAKLQVGKLYTGFNIATGELTAATSTPITSIKTAFEIYSTETPAEGDTEYSMSFITAYMLWPASESVAIVGSFYEDGKDDPVSEVAPTSDIALKRGNLTTLRGEMFDTGWDGSVETPTEIADDWLVINTPGELLWLATAAEAPTLNGTTYSKFRLGKDIDVYDSTAIQSLKVGDNANFDGNGKTISGFGATTTALFGSAQGLNAYNFTLEGYNVTHNGHIGVLVNELSQSATFTDITIKNSSATTTNGAAGGVVGYIAGGEDKNLEVTFTNCHLVGVKATGSLAEGKFVGLMHGYDNEEILSFDADCSATDCSVVDYVSPYAEDNDAQWLDEGETAFDFTTYNGWLGDEEMYRATVKFADHRMQIKWDGETEVDPLMDGTTILIYSPFDLAKVGGTSPTTIRFKSDVDMGGVCEKCKNGGGDATIANDNLCTCADCKKFDPILYLKNIYGESHTIYNLFTQAVHQENNSRGAGFVRKIGSGTVENLTFVGAVVKCIDDKTLRNNPQLGGNAYCGTLTSNAEGNLTLTNVHARNGHILGISKLGGMIGKAGGGLTATNCSVDTYIVENHRIGVMNNYYKAVGSISLYAEFDTEGEAGGFIGFVSAASKIDNCHTNNITMKCYGQDDQKPEVNGLPGKFVIAGRHCNIFIGDIRTADENKAITIEVINCTGNGTYASGYDKDEGKYRYRYRDYTCPIIGCAYYVGVHIGSTGIGDIQGTVKYDSYTMTMTGGYTLW